MTILARDYFAKPKLGVPNPDKGVILQFMKSFEKNDISEGYVENMKTGEVDRRFIDGAYRVDDLFWRVGDTYNLEHNDLELSPEFCARVLELIGQ